MYPAGLQQRCDQRRQRHIIQFDGRHYEITPTSLKSVTVLFHPSRKLWVLEH
jgi:hypothetical protein